MIPFPGSTRSRTLAACLALCLAAGTAVLVAGGGASADDKLKHKQRQVHGEVRSAQGDLEDSSAAVRTARARLHSSQLALVGAQHRLATAQSALAAAARTDALMQARLVTAERSLATAKTQLTQAKAAVVEQRRDIGELAASNYANGDPALMGLAAILNSQDTVAVTTQLNTVTALMSKQTVLLDDLRAAKARMASQESAVAHATAAVAAQRKVAAANLDRKQSLEAAAATARTEYADLVVRNRQARAAALRARKADLRQLHALKKQEQRIKELIIERAARQHGGYSGDTGGFLFRPVPGPVTSPFGWRIHPIYHYWGLHDGTDFGAACGTPLRAAGSGTVVSRMWTDVYGNRLYLDLGQVNGKNMTVVYNHATSYSVSVGQHVRRGQVLGAVGTTGWSTGCHLHFTVLLDGTPVDPMHYM